MIYDLAVIGGGPAGLSSAVYGARYKMNTCIIGTNWGGFVNDAHLVENWLGDTSVSGKELATRMVNHVKTLKIPMITDNVQAIIKKDDHFEAITPNETIKAKRLILALGTARNKLNIPGEDEFLGRGVSYCSTCDGFFFRDKTVAVVGSGDSACTGAVLLSGIAKKVYLIYRSEKLKAEPIWIDKVKKAGNVTVIAEEKPQEIKGENKVEKIVLESGKELNVDGVFIEVGSTPTDVLTKGAGIKTTDKGYIVVDENQKTSVNGIWAAGDITTASSGFKQIVVAAAEGAIAVYGAYIDSKN